MKALSRLNQRTAGKCTFYCRMNNRVVGGCPLNAGPGGCSLRQECAAFSAPGSSDQPSPDTARA